MMTGAVIMAVAIVGVFRVVARWIVVAHRGDALVVVLIVVCRIILAAAALIVDVVVRAVVFSLPISVQRPDIVNSAHVLSAGSVMMEGLESTGERSAPRWRVPFLEPLDSQTRPIPIVVSPHESTSSFEIKSPSLWIMNQCRTNSGMRVEVASQRLIRQDLSRDERERHCSAIIIAER
jgi:hypothetical protein